jgi:hypothetical protein
LIHEDKPMKEFEKPQTGRFNATIIDVIDLGIKVNKFNESKVRIRIVWVLDKNDSEGKPFRVAREVNATIATKPKKSSLYEIAEGVLGHAPSVPFDDESLIGRSNELTLVRETDPTSGKVYANIKAILPLAAGVVAPVAPQGFVRAKFKNQVGTVAPQAQAQAPVAAPANPAPVTAPAAVAAPVVDAQF